MCIAEAGRHVILLETIVLNINMANKVCGYQQIPQFGYCQRMAHARKAGREVAFAGLLEPHSQDLVDTVLRGLGSLFCGFSLGRASGGKEG